MSRTRAAGGTAAGILGQAGGLMWDFQVPLTPGVSAYRKGGYVTGRGVCLPSSYFSNKFYFRPVFDLQNHLQRLPGDAAPNRLHHL